MNFPSFSHIEKCQQKSTEKLYFESERIYNYSANMYSGESW